MSIFTSLSGMAFPGAGPILGTIAVSSCLYFLFDYVPIPRWWDKNAYLIGQMHPDEITGLECPYAYLRQIYGKYHWAPFVHKISPTLRKDDYPKYVMVLEIMDAIHLCLMLVDDVRTNLLELRFSIVSHGLLMELFSDLRWKRLPQRKTRCA